MTNVSWNKSTGNKWLTAEPDHAEAEVKANPELASAQGYRLSALAALGATPGQPEHNSLVYALLAVSAAIEEQSDRLEDSLLRLQT